MEWGMKGLTEVKEWTGNDGMRRKEEMFDG